MIVCHHLEELSAGSFFFFKEKKIQRKEKRSSPPAMKEKAECGFQRFHKGRIQLQALM